MIDIEHTASTWDSGALIRVDQPGAPPLYRPALFVIGDASGGATWVEPCYLDPIGAATPAAHTAEHPVQDATKPNGPPVFTLVSGGWTALAMEMPYDGPDELLQPIQWALGELERKGTTWAAERERVRTLLAAG